MLDIFASVVELIHGIRPGVNVLEGYVFYGGKCAGGNWPVIVTSIAVTNAERFFLFNYRRFKPLKFLLFRVYELMPCFQVFSQTGPSRL